MNPSRAEYPTPTPTASVSAISGPDAEPRIRRLNELIREVADAESVDVLPFHDTLEDPERPGRMKQEWTPDGNHPSVEGHRRLGELQRPDVETQPPV